MGSNKARRQPPAKESTAAAAASQHAAVGPSNAAQQELAAEATSGAGGQYPYLDQIQQSFGDHDVAATAHTGSEAQQATEQLGANAVAQGDGVGFKGQPDLRVAAHEAAHVVQQQGGGVQAGMVGESGDQHEQHADAVADRVVEGQSAVDLLDQVATPGQATAPAQATQLDEAKPGKVVSAAAMKRLGLAEQGINHTKAVLSLGAGNQLDALKATNFNSYFRMACMRDPDCWELDPSVYDLASKYPDALTAAKADLAKGGNCGEHAQVAFDFLRQKAAADVVNRCDVTGLDHAFIILGRVQTEPVNELVVCDPWPTSPTACLWEDHFAFTPDRSKINVRNSVTGDDQDVKAAIAKGLKLSAKGQAMIKYAYDEERTKKEIEQGTKGDHPWIWRHSDAAEFDFDYHVEEPKPDKPGEVAAETPKPESGSSSVGTQPEEQPSREEEAQAEDSGWARFMAWVRAWIG